MSPSRSQQALPHQSPTTIKTSPRARAISPHSFAIIIAAAILFAYLLSHEGQCSYMVCKQPLLSNFLLNLNTLRAVHARIRRHLRPGLRLLVKPRDHWVLLPVPQLTQLHLSLYQFIVTPLTYSSSIKSESAQSQQNTLAGTLTTGTSYTATNQYIKKSSSSYLFVPLPGPGGNCVPGLVNITTTGTFACKIIPTA